MVPSLPPYIKATSFSLTFGSETLTINRRPAFSNTLELFKNRIFHDSNDFNISFRSTYWPKYNKLNCDLFPISRQNAEDVETFMYNHLGEIITMKIDNLEYKGVITNTKLEVVDERNDECNFKVSFNFETETL